MWELAYTEGWNMWEIRQKSSKELVTGLLPYPHLTSEKENVKTKPSINKCRQEQVDSRSPQFHTSQSYWTNEHIYWFATIVQKNRNFLKEYWILRNILLPFNRIRIWFSNILLPLKGSRIRVVKILLQQNFNRIFRFWQPLALVQQDAQYVTFFSGNT